MSSENARSELSGVPTAELRYFLETKGTPVPDGTTRDQIFHLVRDNHAAQISQLRRPVSELERQNTEHRVTSHLEENFEEQFRRRVDEKVAGLTVLRNVNAILVGVVAVITGLGAFLGVSSFQGIERQEKELGGMMKDVSELQDKSQKIISDHQEVTSAHRRSLIRRIIQDCDEALSSFSLSLLNEELFKKVRQNREDMKMIFPTSAVGGHQAEEAQILDVLTKLSDGILGFQKLTSERNSAERAGTLTTAGDVWRRLDLRAAVHAEEYQSFLVRARAHQKNILGVIKLIRYREQESDVRPIALLNQAADLFNEAKDICPELSRPYSNLAVVASYKAKLPQNSSIQAQRDLLEENQSNLALAYSYASSARDRSIVLNNLAYSYFREARLLREKVGDEQAARTVLGHAREAVEKAQALVQPTAAVFLTAAEIACYRVLIERQRWEESEGPDAKRSEFEEIVELLQEAKKREYSGFATWTMKELLEEMPVLEHLKILNPDFMQNVAKKLGLAD